ncbi:MAG TPA: alkene reductase [Acetobacteraceae bacterium]|nr:alkene reductase [Acetobacteraceae bacterium]
MKPILFSPITLGNLTLPSRIVMAPLTRARSAQPGDIPTEMAARYYAQRASAALIISEASYISRQAKGYDGTPGCFTPEQLAGWKKVVDAVHAKGGRIFLQIWHVGRMSHPDFHDGHPPVAPSAMPVDENIWKVDPDTGIGSFVPVRPPRAMTHGEIKQTVQDFRLAARNAVDIGFDGVEIHGANGYLVDQFMRTTSNVRTDEYGGSRENRLRFVREVITAVAEEVGPDRVGIRLAPFLTFRGMGCPDILPTIAEAASFANDMGIAYLHLVEADFDHAPEFTEEFRKEMRERFKGNIIMAGLYDREKADWVLEKGYADMVAFGRLFLANPDLPYRLEHELPMNPVDNAHLMGGGDEGYTDYPFFARDAA